MKPDLKHPAANTPPPVVRDTGGLAGHPRGLTTLFFTEMGERFSFYEVKAILIFYMVAAVAEGGLGLATHTAGLILGTYTLALYVAAIPGGIIADRWLGKWRAVFAGGIVIAAGQLLMVVPGLFFFATGLCVTVVGTGLLKPNISAMLGELYTEDDPRRDAGFSLFYMGINIGAALAPFVCGILAQTQWFRSVLSSFGFNPNWCWHFGFAAGGCGMVLGLIQFWAHRKRLADVGARPKPDRSGSAAGSQPLTKKEWLRIAAIGVLFFFTVLFWTVSEQAGSSLSLFAKDLTSKTVFGFSLPPAFFQALNPLFIIVLAPLFSKLWMILGKRQPDSPVKFACGLAALGAGIALMVPASLLTAGGARVSPLWLVGTYLLGVIGELCLSPVGLSTVTRLAPRRLVGLMIGVWFLAAACGGFAAGVIGGFFDAGRPLFLAWFFGLMAAGLFLAAGLLALLRKQLKKLMGDGI